MAFEVYVYFVPRAKSAQIRTTGSTPGDDTLVIFAPDLVTWKQPPSFVPLAVTVQFTGALPEAGEVTVTTIETPPSWTYRPFPRPWAPRQAFTAPPGDDSVAPTPEYSQGRVTRDEFRNPYDPRYAMQFVLNTSAFDDSVVIATLADAPGSIPRNVHRKDYRAVIYLGAGALDDTLDLDNFTRPVQRPPFRDPYKPFRALDHLFNISFDDTVVFAAQPDQQSTIVRRVFRQPYDARRVAVEFSGVGAFDDSVAVAPQEETHGVVVRNTHQRMYDARRAAVKFSGIEAHDDSTAVAELTGGVYIPSIRRRRR